MPNRNKEKGKRFEEKLAEIIRIYWLEINDRSKVHRALSSGNYQEVEYSDIVFNIQPKPHLIVEAKYRTTDKFTKRFDGLQSLINSSEFRDWFKQINTSANDYKAKYEIFPIRLIVIGVPRYEPKVVIPLEDMEKLYFASESFNLTWEKSIYETFFKTNKYPSSESERNKPNALSYEYLFDSTFETLEFLTVLTLNDVITGYTLITTNLEDSKKIPFVIMNFQDLVKLLRPIRK